MPQPLAFVLGTFEKGNQRIQRRGFIHRVHEVTFYPLHHLVHSGRNLLVGFHLPHFGHFRALFVQQSQQISAPQCLQAPSVPSLTGLPHLAQRPDGESFIKSEQLIGRQRLDPFGQLLNLFSKLLSLLQIREYWLPQSYFVREHLELRIVRSRSRSLFSLDPRLRAASALSAVSSAA